MRQQLMILLFLMCTVITFAQPVIKGGEYFLGTIDPGNGNGTSFSVVDGAWDNVVEDIIATAQTISSTTSPILINIRLKDNSNNWGSVFKKTLFFNTGNTNNRSVNITSAEYFIGLFDPGQGQGTPIIAFDGAWDNVVEDIIATAQTISSTTSPILINIRLKDNSNNWGPVFKKTLFFNTGNTNSRSVNITSAEYFIGLFDPGQGQGTPIIAFDGALDEAVETVLRTSATWTVSTGPTLFNIRLRDAYNNWGPLFKKTIFLYGANTNVKLIIKKRFFFISKNFVIIKIFNTITFSA